MLPSSLLREKRFEFKKNSELIFYDIDPTDRVQKQKGY